MPRVNLMTTPGRIGFSRTTEGTQIHPQDKCSILVQVGEVVNLKDGELVAWGDTLSANSTYLLRPAARPSLHRTEWGVILVSWRPELAMAGAIVTPVSPIIRTGDEDALGLLVRTTKKIDTSDMSKLIFELHLMD